MSQFVGQQGPGVFEVEGPGAYGNGAVPLGNGIPFYNFGVDNHLDTFAGEMGKPRPQGGGQALNGLLHGSYLLIIIAIAAILGQRVLAKNQEKREQEWGTFHGATLYNSKGFQSRDWRGSIPDQGMSRILVIFAVPLRLTNSTDSANSSIVT